MTEFIDGLWECIIDPEDGLIHKQHTKGVYWFPHQFVLLKEATEAKFNFEEEPLICLNRDVWCRSLRAIDDIIKRLGVTHYKKTSWLGHASDFANANAPHIKDADVLVTIIIYPKSFVILLEWQINLTKGNSLSKYYKSGLICDSITCNGDSFWRGIEEKTQGNDFPKKLHNIELDEFDLRYEHVNFDKEGRLTLRRMAHKVDVYRGSVLYSITTQKCFAGDTMLIQVLSKFDTNNFKIDLKALNRWKKHELIFTDTEAQEGTIGLIRRDPKNLANIEFIFKMGDNWDQIYSYSIKPRSVEGDDGLNLGIFTEDVTMVYKDLLADRELRDLDNLHSQNTTKKAKIDERDDVMYRDDLRKEGKPIFVRGRRGLGADHKWFYARTLFPLKSINKVGFFDRDGELIHYEDEVPIHRIQTVVNVDKGTTNIKVDKTAKNGFLYLSHEDLNTFVSKFSM